MYASCFFFFNDTATTEIYTLSLHDALPIWWPTVLAERKRRSAISRLEAPSASRASTSTSRSVRRAGLPRSEEDTSELQSRQYLVCRLLLEKKNYTKVYNILLSAYKSPMILL